LLAFWSTERMRWPDLVWFYRMDFFFSGFLFALLWLLNVQAFMPLMSWQAIL
jgi:hypothetical protein